MNRLKELRKEKKLTQKQLADAIGTTKLTISNWENEKHFMGSDKAQILADFFDVPVGYLLGYSDSFFSEESKKLDRVLTTARGEDGDPLKREELQNIIATTEDDERLINYGKIRLVSVIQKKPENFLDDVNDDFFRMLAVAPPDYFHLLSSWFILSPEQKTATLNLLQSFTSELEKNRD